MDHTTPTTLLNDLFPHLVPRREDGRTVEPVQDVDRLGTREKIAHLYYHGRGSETYSEVALVRNFNVKSLKLDTYFVENNFLYVEDDSSRPNPGTKT